MYSQYGRGITSAVNRDLPNLSARLRATSGSVQSLGQLGRGQADIAFTRADSAQEFRAGRADIVALARLYDSYVQVVVRDDSSVRAIVSPRPAKTP